MELSDNQKTEVTNLRNTARSLRYRAHISIEEAEQCEAAANQIDPPETAAPAPIQAPEGK